MIHTIRKSVGVVGCLLLFGPPASWAQDWPQWRGPNRDAKAVGFEVPKSWPKQLTQKWKVSVGDGVATPALVGDKLFVFSRQDGNEVIRCLDAAGGKELWQDKYEAQPATGAASSFPGPRSSPTVVDGKVLLLGVRGMLSCYDAASGKKVWQKDDFKSWPMFFTSSSPIVVDGLCIAQLGGRSGTGAIVAYDVSTGEPRWKWVGDSPAYASPELIILNGTKLIVAQATTKMLALNAADGKVVWEAPFPVQGRGYNAVTPIVDGQTVIYGGSGRGFQAVKLEKSGDHFDAKELWKNTETSPIFSTPVLKDGRLYGITQTNEFFCINAEDGKTAWKTPGEPMAGGGRQVSGGSRPAGGGQRPAGEQADAQRRAPGGEGQPGGAGRPPGGGDGQQPAGRGRGGRRGGGGANGYGSIVDAGPVLFALTPASQLTVFEPSDKGFKQLAKYKVSETPTYAYPVLSGNRIFIKDRDALTLWTIE
jgi:outer membrane protein assembly factor BamB